MVIGFIMQVTTHDKILIKILLTLEGYNAKRVFWQRWNKLLQKLQITGSVDRHPGSGRRCSAGTADNSDLVYELLLQARNDIYILYT